MVFTLPPTAPATLDSLKSIIDVLNRDPGLEANVTPVDMSYGISSAKMLNKLLAEAIDATGANRNGSISTADVKAIADFIQDDAARASSFATFHGNDSGAESGYHLLDNEGAKWIFRGQNVVDVVIDSVYLIGFGYSGDFLLDQNGNASTSMAVAAGWLNYFLNGENRVYGSSGDDYLTTGDYSIIVADAANEIFDGGAGNDQIYAGKGNDIIDCGLGDDRSGGGSDNDTIDGGEGMDQLYGEDGRDVLNGDEGADGLYGGLRDDTANGGEGNDTLHGNEGTDRLSGGTGDDTISGGDGKDFATGNAGQDTIYGDAGDDKLLGLDGSDSISGSDGDDTLDGGEGGDQMSGGFGDDTLTGGAGKDSLNGNDGADNLRGGTGADIITLWDNDDARDVLAFEMDDSGVTLTTIDVVDGFASGQDVVNLRSFGSHMTFEDLDFAGGHASVYFDGQYLRIDQDGDRATDMIVRFNGLSAMTEDDFLFA